MAIKLYNPDPQRQAILDALENPVSTTMPVGRTNASIIPDAPGASGGRRDQWSAPGTVARRGDMSRLSGFDAGKFGGDEQTLKYQAGGIFSGFDPTGGVGQLFADEEFKRLYPGATQVGDDKIDWGHGNGPLDVIENFGTSGAKWAWPSDGGSAGGAAPGGQAPAPNGQPQQSNMAAILAEIQALSDGTESPLSRKAIMDLLLEQGLPGAI